MAAASHIRASREYVIARMDRAMSNRPVLPFLGLQYGLCEIGPRRFDPRVLANRLSQLIPTDPTFRIVADHVYAAYTAPASETMALLSELTELSNQVATEIAAATTIIAEQIEKLFSAKTRHDEVGRTEILASSVSIQQRSLVLESMHNRQAHLTWIIHEFDWLYPTDSRFWRFLGDASASDAHPMIITRKASPATFVLCKAFGAKALQYYGLVSQTPMTGEARERAKAFRFPPILDPKALAEHRVWEHVSSDTEPASPKAQNAALLDALSRNFDKGDPTPAQLLDWEVDHPELDLPPEWIEGVNAWIDEPTVSDLPAPPPSEKGRDEPIFGRKTEVSRVPIPG